MTLSAQSKTGAASSCRHDVQEPRDCSGRIVVPRRLRSWAGRRVAVRALHQAGGTTCRRLHIDIFHCACVWFRCTSGDAAVIWQIGQCVSTSRVRDVLLFKPSPLWLQADFSKSCQEFGYKVQTGHVKDIPAANSWLLCRCRRIILSFPLQATLLLIALC